MTERTSQLRRTVRQTRQRLLVVRGQALLARTVGASIALSIALLILDRATTLSVAPWIHGVLIGLGIISGAVLTALRPPTDHDAAVAIDHRLHLKDRVGSALTLPDITTDDPVQSALAEMLSRDAESHAGGINARHVVPFSWSRTWYGTSAACIILIAAWIGLPEFAWARSAAEELNNPEIAAQREAEEQARAELARDLQNTLNDARRDLDVIDAPIAEELEALDRLSEQLTGPSDEDPANPDQPRSLDDARSKAAGRLSDVADQLDEQAERERRSREALTERFEGMPRPDRPMTTDEFRRALERGEFGEAANALEELLNEAEAAEDAATAQQIAQDLRELADAMNEAGAETDPALAEREQQLRDAMRELGMNDAEIDELLNERPTDEDSATPPSTPDQGESTDTDAPDAADADADDSAPSQDPETTEQEDAADSADPDPMPRDPGKSAEDELRERGVDEDVARKLARDIEELEKQKDAEEQSRRDAQELSESTRQAAEKADPNRDDTQPEQDPSQDPARQSDSNQQGEQQQQQTDTNRQGEQQQQQTDLNKQGEQQQQQTDPNKQGEEQQQQQTDPNQQGEQPQQQTDPNQEGGQEQDAEDESPSDLLRRLAERAAEGDQKREISESMRERARELAEKMTPEERQRWLEQWQKNNPDRTPPTDPSMRNPRQDQQRSPADQDQNQQQGGQPRDTDADGDSNSRRPGNRPGRDAEGTPRTDPITAPDDELQQRNRGDDPAADRKVGEVEGDGRNAEPLPGELTPAQRAERFRQAQEVAERAVNESAVPRRYHRLIRRYFERMRSNDADADNSASGGDTSSSSESSTSSPGD